jgi:hypothetical protein
MGIIVHILVYMSIIVYILVYGSIIVYNLSIRYALASKVNSKAT